MIGDHYITAVPWRKGFNPRAHSITSTLVWLQLPDLPIELYHPEAVLRIASRAGRPIRLDRATETGARAKFARVCVEVDLTKPLLSKFKVAGIEYEIKYEGLYNVCFQCGRYGHSQASCPNNHSDRSQEEAGTSNDSTHTRHEEQYGDWMIAKRRDRRPYPKKTQVDGSRETSSSQRPPQAQVAGSRFAALMEEEEEGVDNQSVNRHLRSQDTQAMRKPEQPPQRQVWREKNATHAGPKKISKNTMSNHRPETQVDVAMQNHAHDVTRTEPRESGDSGKDKTNIEEISNSLQCDTREEISSRSNVPPSPMEASDHPQRSAKPPEPPSDSGQQHSLSPPVGANKSMNAVEVLPPADQTKASSQVESPNGGSLAAMSQPAL
ncbi:unnamed protein product [Linum tenue]|uniref:CCHC-type domain-containing protein n=1 Tax=Linum tenue TaxID=586396 RepID=A0AAV0KBT6_9ROSI|nr:unnamed protein product [Linum tenue]